MKDILPIVVSTNSESLTVQTGELTSAVSVRGQTSSIFHIFSCIFPAI